MGWTAYCGRLFGYVEHLGLVEKTSKVECLSPVVLC